MFRHAPVMLILAWIVSSAPGSAQSDDTHKGYWLSFGGGGGWMENDRAASFYVRMGGTPNSRVQFGSQVLHWWHEHHTQHTQVTATAAVFPLYPRRGRSHGSVFREWFVRMGFGIATAHCHSEDDTGIGAALGTGFDVRMGNNFFVTPNLDLLFDFFTHRTDRSLLFTLGLTWH